MLGFVEGQMESLIKLCFGELQAQDRRTKRLSRLLLADYDSPDLAPLQLTLQMDDDDRLTWLLARLRERVQGELRPE